ncbi:hypothetical protein J009_00034 [Cryptococcus neoformans]|nr:hypothetical protein J009_00034 [Cryptococcus neoformans var. grubii]OXH61089.1 hypothetical protein J004_00038 [Cryptococcus neoformans var. grubii]OXH73872.1 hypothetical protein J001_01520 [Cryptococcus neoformans var. grubii]
MFLQLERNQEFILKELAILKCLFASQSPSALTGSKPSQKYSDLASGVVNAFLITPFSDLFYGSNLASIIHDAAVACKVGGVPNARHPDRHDFRKEVTRKLTVWRSERKQARYSTYRVGSPLSPKVENFWKVAAKEMFELGELGEKERRVVLEFVFREDEARFGGCQHWDNQCTPPCGPTKRVHGVASHELKLDGAHVEEGQGGRKWGIWE